MRVGTDGQRRLSPQGLGVRWRFGETPLCKAGGGKAVSSRTRHRTPRRFALSYPCYPCHPWSRSFPGLAQRGESGPGNDPPSLGSYGETSGQGNGMAGKARKDRKELKEGGIFPPRIARM